MLEHAIWWHVYPLGAVGAAIRTEHGDPAPRLRRLEAWLDYAVELGCNGLLLNPVFASVSHGYDTLDYYRVDPRLGDDADLDRLIAQCRDRGMLIVLDGVFNHVAREHPWVLARPDLIAHDDDGVPRAWEGHDSLVELDHANPAVADLVVDVMGHWLRRGIAGWRLDVAYAVPAAFWRDVTARVRAEFPDAVFLGEVIHGDYPAFVADAGLTTVTQYELWKAIWSSLKDTNLWELAHAIERHAAFCRSFLPQTFVGNHDVTRIASLVGSARAALAAGILMLLPGSPSVYYGDEQGYAGIKRDELGGDDDVRPLLPPSPADLSPLGAPIHQAYRDAIGFRRRHPWLASGAVEVTARANERLAWRVTAGEQICDVVLDLTAGTLVAVAADETLTIGA